MECPSDDQETLRVMNVAWRPKSVMRRIGPPAVGCAQIFVVGPSVSSTASHLPSGESTGCIRSQLDKRDPEMRAKFCAGPFSGLATSISMSDNPFSAGKLITKKSLPSASIAGFCPSARTGRLLPSAGEAFARRNPFSPGGEKYSHRLSGDQHAQPPPSEIL